MVLWWKEGYFTRIQPTVNLTVAFETNEQLELCIYDTLGRKVYSAAAKFDDLDRCNLDVSQLKEGMYFVALEGGEDRLFVERMIKK